MAKAVKLADIAGRLGVSNVTVSKALSGQKGVSEEMREKIIRLADELGYRQPSARRREAAGGSCSIGVLISERYLDKYDSFYRLICQQVATEAVRQECFTMMEPVEHEAEDQPALPRLVQEQRVDGLLVIGRLAEGYRSLRWRDMVTSSIRDSATCPSRPARWTQRRWRAGACACSQGRSPERITAGASASWRDIW